MKIFQRVLGGTVALSLALSLIGPISPVFAATAESLGTADSFDILAGSAVTSSNTSVIDQNVGLSPAAGTFYFGLDSAEVAGTIYAVDATGPDGAPGNNPGLLTTAKVDAKTAYDNALAQPTDTVLVGTDLSTYVSLPPGVYDDNDAPNSIAITAGNSLTLDGGGDPDAVFIFKTGSTFTMGVGSSILLTGEAQACNVFWIVGSSANFDTSTVEGNVLAVASITDAGNSTINGRLLADANNDGTGAVTVDFTTLTRADCAVPPSSGGSASIGYINVTKVVVNDGGGTKTVADFPLFVNGNFIASGVTNQFGTNSSQAYQYDVTETNSTGYTRTFSGDCNASGQVFLNPNETKFCIITNNDINAPAIPVIPPLIAVVKVPSPLSLPGGPGMVNYTYTTRNIGTVPMTNVTMVGDTCSPITLTSGDTNGNAILEVSETWVYNCSTNLTATHTNTVVATGWANGISAVDIASATVVVGLPIVPPLIHVTKVPSPLAFGAGGGMVVYTNKVTNPGTVPLSNVFISDDKCSPVKNIFGDTNLDVKLDPSETWTYTCTKNLTATTTNTVSARGEANGITVRDFAIATVVVAAGVPALPNTGVSPQSTLGWSLLTGLLAGALLLYGIRKSIKV